MGKRTQGPFSQRKRTLGSFPHPGFFSSTVPPRSYESRVVVPRIGLQGHDAEDLCQDVFVCVLAGGVLAKADPDRGRFRSLLLAVTTHVIFDRLRKRCEVPVEDIEPPQPDAPDEFDRSWALHGTERAIQRL